MKMTPASGPSPSSSSAPVLASNDIVDKKVDARGLEICRRRECDRTDGKGGGEWDIDNNNVKNINRNSIYSVPIRARGSGGAPPRQGREGRQGRGRRRRGRRRSIHAWHVCDAGHCCPLGPAITRCKWRYTASIASDIQACASMQATGVRWPLL